MWCYVRTNIERVCHWQFTECIHSILATALPTRRLSAEDTNSDTGLEDEPSSKESSLSGGEGVKLTNRPPFNLRNVLDDLATIFKFIDIG
jgi:hypothetical protein